MKTLIWSIFLPIQPSVKNSYEFSRHLISVKVRHAKAPVSVMKYFHWAFLQVPDLHICESEVTFSQLVRTTSYEKIKRSNVQNLEKIRSIETGVTFLKPGFFSLHQDYPVLLFSQPRTVTAGRLRRTTEHIWIQGSLVIMWDYGFLQSWIFLLAEWIFSSISIHDPF